MVVDFGRGSGFVVVDFGWFCGGLWVNGGVAGFCLGFKVARLLDFAASLGGSWSWFNEFCFLFCFLWLDHGHGLGYLIFFSC